MLSSTLNLYTDRKDVLFLKELPSHLQLSGCSSLHMGRLVLIVRLNEVIIDLHLRGNDFQS